MRTWLAGALILLALAGWMASGSADALDTTKVFTVVVSEQGFTPSDPAIRKGWTVHWVSDAGTYTILSGTPEDPVEDQGKDFKVALVGDKASIDQFVSLEVGKYDFFVEGQPTLRGTLTVQEPTPINPTTWGFLKRMFEN